MVNIEIFAERRTRLLGKMLPKSVAIIPTAPIANYSHDTDYLFRPDSNFYYLTGFREPESCAIITNVEGKPGFTLFVRKRDRAMETWTGRRIGVEGAKEKFKADETFEISELDEKLAGYLENTNAIYHFPGKYRAWDKKILKAWQQVRMKWRMGIDPPVELFDLGHIMHEMRLVKTGSDMEIMRQACRISAEAVALAMKAAKPGMNEREIEALVNHYFRASGSFGPGFPTIVASGVNATILHYTENERDIEKNDLILLDAGCEFEMYNGDITRTFPASGKFTPEAKSIYEIVLEAQKNGIEYCTTDKTPDDMHNRAVRILVEGLVHLGFLKGSIDEIIGNETYKIYYMHKTGHWLGTDVHDVGSMRKAGEIRKFEPGMVTTVEPGIYLPDDDEDLPKAFRGIGVRIEDDVHITIKGPEILTSTCPKGIDEIENFMSGK